MTDNRLTDAEFDQQLAETRDRLPRIWWALYQGNLEVGFSEAQALRLTIAFIEGSRREE